MGFVVLFDSVRYMFVLLIISTASNVIELYNNVVSLLFYAQRHLLVRSSEKFELHVFEL